MESNNLIVLRRKKNYQRSLLLRWKTCNGERKNNGKMTKKKNKKMKNKIKELVPDPDEEGEE